MEVESEADQFQAFDDLLTGPLQFISALANQVESHARNRKEAAAKEAAAKKALFEIKMSVEGYQPSELDVKLIENSVTISGKHEHEDETGVVSRNFTRKWIIPDDVKLEELTCNFNSKDNTMMISAPRKVEVPQVQEKVIPINVSGKEVPAVEKDTETITPGTSEEDAMKTASSDEPTLAA